MRNKKNLITGEQLEATKSLLKLYKTVLQNVNNRLYDLDELTYVTTRKHLTDLVGGLVEFEIQDNPGTFNDRINSCYKSLSLLEMIDESVVLVHDYPDNGRLYYDIINLYYMGISENSHEDVMEMLDLTRATYYRSHKKALECFYLHFITVLKKANYTFDTQKLLNEYA